MYSGICIFVFTIEIVLLSFQEVMAFNPDSIINQSIHNLIKAKKVACLNTFTISSAKNNKLLYNFSYSVNINNSKDFVIHFDSLNKILINNDSLFLETKYTNECTKNTNLEGRLKYCISFGKSFSPHFCFKYFEKASPIFPIDMIYGNEMNYINRYFQKVTFVSDDEELYNQKCYHLQLKPKNGIENVDWWITQETLLPVKMKIKLDFPTDTLLLEENIIWQEYKIIPKPIYIYISELQHMEEFYKNYFNPFKYITNLDFANQFYNDFDTLINRNTLKDKYNIIVYWFSSCSSCRSNLIFYNSIYDSLLINNFNVIGYNYMYKNGDEIFNFIKNKNIKFPNYYNNSESAVIFNFKISFLLGYSYPYPLTLLLNEKWTIIDIFPDGYNSKQELINKHINQLK